MFSAITQVRMYCSPSMGANAQRELIGALSTALGAIAKAPLRDSTLDARLLQSQATIIATRRRFLRLPPECLWVVVYGSTAETVQALANAEPSPMYKVTERHITSVSTDENAV